MPRPPPRQGRGRRRLRRHPRGTLTIGPYGGDSWSGRLVPLLLRHDVALTPRPLLSARSGNTAWSETVPLQSRDLTKLDYRRAQGAALGSWLSAGERADMEDEPGEWNDLTIWRVVVRTEREPRDALRWARYGGQHQDHRRVVVGDHPAGGVARNAGETTVQDNHLLAAQQLGRRESRNRQPKHVRSQDRPAAIARVTTFMLPVAHWRVKVSPAIRQPSGVRVSW